MLTGAGNLVVERYVHMDIFLSRLNKNYSSECTLVSRLSDAKKK